MPARAGATIYGPLYIDDSQRDGDGDDAHQVPYSYYLPSRIIARHYLHLRCRCQMRQFCTIFLLILSIIASALFATKELFHLSFPNLLRTIFGAGKKGSSTTAVCLTHLLHGSRTTVESMVLNRTALAFNKGFQQKLNKKIMSSGFLWDSEDGEITKWRPQGVTTFHSNGRRFVLVSWYGRKDEGYSDRGGRISFVDISDMHYNVLYHNAASNYSYSHVLLVDEKNCALPNIHVGGIEQQNGILYVADSRKGQQSILEFDIASGLYELPSDMMDSMFGYRYVLRQSSSFHSPTKPSFISYDIDNEKFVVGTYARCGKKLGIHIDSESCFSQPKNRLVWFNKHDVDLNSTEPCWHYFSEMQGAVSARVDNSTIVWVSSSYGPIADSHLHVVRAPTSFNGECPGVNLDEVSIFQFPPGLEDLHIEETEVRRYMWMATEFGTRMVLSTPIQNLL